MSNLSTGQQPHSANVANYHRPSKMNAAQLQAYCDLLCQKVDTLGERYVARQLEWAVAELERVQAVDAWEVPF